MIAKAVANNGVVDMTSLQNLGNYVKKLVKNIIKYYSSDSQSVSLETYLDNIEEEEKFINLPPGKLSAPAMRNHRKTPAGKARISGV